MPFEHRTFVFALYAFLEKFMSILLERFPIVTTLKNFSGC